jgi:antitoxin component of RelBE/YafQ-DinJ toxin-antitoxin module
VSEHRKHIILSEKHKAALERLAAESGLNESDVIRLLILQAAKKGWLK